MIIPKQNSQKIFASKYVSRNKLRSSWNESGPDVRVSKPPLTNISVKRLLITSWLSFLRKFSATTQTWPSVQLQHRLSSLWSVPSSHPWSWRTNMLIGFTLCLRNTLLWLRRWDTCIFRLLNLILWVSNYNNISWIVPATYNMALFLTKPIRKKN